MRKAGGIVAVIGGVFGIFAALVTLFVGGIGGAFHANQADLVVGLGWGGILFSFLVIALGAVCIGAQSMLPSMLLVFCALAGMVLGGTLVAVFMGLALIGGVLALFGGSPKSDGASRGQSPDIGERQLPSPRGQSPDFNALDADQMIARYAQEIAQRNASGKPVAQQAPSAGFGRRRAN